MCPFSILAFLQPTTVDKEPKKGGLLHFGVKSPLLEMYSFSIILFNNA